MDNIKNKRLYVMLVKNNPCCDCGKKYHYSQMQLDHIEERGEKIFEINSRAFSGKSIDDIKEELKKCDLLCSNCHSLRTFLRKINQQQKDFINNKDLNNLTNEDIIKIYENNCKINYNKRKEEK